MKITASAPGKLMLLGEHAVVYGYPCIVTAVDLRFSVTIERDPQAQISVDTPVLRKNDRVFSTSMRQVLEQSTYPRAVAFVLAAIKQFYSLYPFQGGLKITTAGPEISYGLGSSSAITAAMVAALAELNQVRLTLQEIYSIAFDAVLAVQGKGSGFDVAAAVYGGTLYFGQGGQVIEILHQKKLPVVIGFSGDKVSTTNLVQQVAGLKERYPDHVAGIFNLIGKIVVEGRKRIEAGEWENLGGLINLNQGLLEALGVSTLQLSRQIYAAREHGAYGAKLSGAGGGDCMFALVGAEKREAVSWGIEQAGGVIVPNSLNADGVRIE
jgi:mevalonate kinase